MSNANTTTGLEWKASCTILEILHNFDHNARRVTSHNVNDILHYYYITLYVCTLHTLQPIYIILFNKRSEPTDTHVPLYIREIIVQSIVLSYYSIFTWLHKLKTILVDSDGPEKYLKKFPSLYCHIIITR